jgi:hypothetical protein
MMTAFGLSIGGASGTSIQLLDPAIEVKRYMPPKIANR